ncbi:MAG: dephospho-CoA kinase [Peptococcaceae bacterium]|nr:dephospho-CoA kinase [Peptococcaceae bacterium]
MIGLTGGIASGKTLISAELARLGAVIVDGDTIAREVTAAGSQGLMEISRVFGPDYLNEKGDLKRKELGALVFGDPEKLRLLNAITHPLIRREMEARIQKAGLTGEKIVVLAVPLLFEAKLDDLADEVWVVAAAKDRQLARLMRRDSLGRTAALDRIQSQMPLAEKLARADVVIDNDGEQEDTLAQVRLLWQEITAKAGNKHGE